MKPSSNDLRERYQIFKEANPKVRIRNAAHELGVSEMQLLETEIGTNAVRLEGDWSELLKRIPDMGTVMALTRNEYAVHERKGVYKNLSFMKKHEMGLAVGEDIDLRLFMKHWVHAFATQKETGGQRLYSFQFFNEYGEAVHKIYTTPTSNLNAYYQILESFKSERQAGITKLLNRTEIPKNEIPDSFVDKEAFQEEWKALKDTHDFFGMVKKYSLTRKQALRLAPNGYAYPVDKSAVETVLEGAAEKGIPIMVFVDSKGCIQIHTGEIKKTFKMGEWFNIMDPMFNLHLNMKGVDDVWVVKKPTKDGIVTSIELFDKNGALVAYCFGKRKPGIPELESWKRLIEDKTAFFVS